MALAIGATALAGNTGQYESQLKGRQMHSDAKAEGSVIMNRQGNMSPRTAIITRSDEPTREKIVMAYGDGINFVDQYGELELKLEEDFSLLTTGTADEPDSHLRLDYTIFECLDLFDNVWYTFKPEYTHIPNWGTNSSYSAGGMLCLVADDGESHLNTPLLKLDDYEGLGVLEFKVRNRIPGGVYNGLFIEAAETNGMTATWRFLENGVIEGITDQWTTFRVLMPNCGPTTMFNIVMMAPGELLIDDVRVYEIKPNVGIPEIKAHTEYKGSSFVANWNAVEGADKYLLSVYHYGGENDRYYFLEDEEVNGTSYEVTGVESGEIYFYTVKAVKGNQVSFESNEHRVFDLETPRFKPVEMTGDHTYTASWEFVPGADVFNYFAFNKRVAETDGLFIVTDENFDGVTDAEGYPTGLTKEDPETVSYDEFYPMQMKQQGWKGTNSYAYTDYISLDSYFYETGQGDSGFISPEMDFSKDGGKFTVSVDLAGETTYIDDETGKQYAYTTQTCVALFNYNEELGDYEQVELVYPETPVTEDFKTFEFKLTKGSARSKVGIYAIRSYGNLYLDNLRITQEYKKDEYLIEPFLFDHWYGRNEEDDPYVKNVDVPAYASGMEVYHQVSAFAMTLVSEMYGQKQYEKRESKYTDREYVGTTTKYSGVQGVQLQESKVSVNGNVVSIMNPMGQKVTVCDVNGTVLFSTRSAAAEYRLPARGIYVVNGKKVVY